MRLLLTIYSFLFYFFLTVRGISTAVNVCELHLNEFLPCRVNSCSAFFHPHLSFIDNLSQTKVYAHNAGIPLVSHRLSYRHSLMIVITLPMVTVTPPPPTRHV